jgi:hypothetical protein
MATNKKLITLATGGTKKATHKEVVKKEKVVEKVLSPDEQRDLKAKETVKELLDGVELDITKPKEELLEMDNGSSDEQARGDDWLQEQVALLTSENEILRIEANAAKADYQKMLAENQAIKAGAGIQGNDELKTGILTIFHEIQSNFMKNPGFTPHGTPNFVIVPAAFLNRLIVFFPFLQREKRF